MASLQDQLLKAGLVNEKKAKQAKKDKRKQNKQALKSKQPVIDENKEAVKKAQQEKFERDKALNKERQDQAQQKAIAAQIKQLIELNKIDRANGELAYNFEHNGKFKKIYVTKKLQDLLSIGQLAIVNVADGHETRFEIVAKPVAEKIAQRDDKAVVLLNQKSPTSETTSEEEDWYADYEIPDDLMW